MFKGVFWKTGFRSDWSTVIENNFLPFGRNEILDTLERYVPQTDNQIFLDYYEYVKNFGKEVSLFRTIPVSEWNWLQINGFYEYLQQNPDKIEELLRS